MCGIAGYFSENFLNHEKLIMEMNSKIYHRGPDSNGFWLDKKIGIAIGHQRLSILDLSQTGNQPMISNSERYVLSFNGEIYNYQDLKKELIQNSFNIKWRGSSDTETLLNALEFWGIEKTLLKIKGMFAFMIWDKKKKKITIARDRMGEKPIYYGWQENNNKSAFIFASELKALKVHPSFENKINRESLSLLTKYNCIPAPFSIYKKIYKLLPGHFLELNHDDLIKKNLPKSKSYWSLKEKVKISSNNLFNLNESELINKLDEILSFTIKNQMLSDVPIGSFLSSGVDSSLVTALMQKQSSDQIKSFTIGFQEFGHDEAKNAKKISKYLGTDHTELYLTSNDAMKIIPNLSTTYCEPFSDSSQIPTFFLSKLASKSVKVSLSGDGADELFCGYNRYSFTSMFWGKISLIPLSIRKILSKIILNLPPKFWSNFFRIFYIKNYNNASYKIQKGALVLTENNIKDVYLKIISHWQNPSEILKEDSSYNLVNDSYVNLINSNEIENMMISDLLNYLPNDILVKVDRAAMANSLEARMPFLDNEVIDFAWRIPFSLKFREQKTKWILRQVLKKYLPEKLFEGPKKGFGIPLDIWLRGPLKDWAASLLDEKKLREQGFFKAEIVSKKFSEHILGQRNWHYHLWDILMFQSWLDKEKS